MLIDTNYSVAEIVAFEILFLAIYIVMEQQTPSTENVAHEKCADTKTNVISLINN